MADGPDVVFQDAVEEAEPQSANGVKFVDAAEALPIYKDIPAGSQKLSPRDSQSSMSNDESSSSENSSSSNADESSSKSCSLHDNFDPGYFPSSRDEGDEVDLREKSSINENASGVNNSSDDEGVDINKALELKEKGNQSFREHLLEEALGDYNAALDFVPKAEKLLAAQIFCNIAAVQLANQAFEAAVDACTSAIELQPEYAKAYLRRYRGNLGLNKVHPAAEDLQKACDLDMDVRLAMRVDLQVIKQKSAEQFEHEKTEMIGKLKDFGNWALGKVGLSMENFQVNQDPTTGSYNIKFNNAPNAPPS